MADWGSMEKGNQYVNNFYEKYEGRVTIGVGYGKNLSEFFPFIFTNTAGDAIGIVVLGVVPESEDNFHIYYMGAF